MGGLSSIFERAFENFIAFCRAEIKPAQSTNENWLTARRKSAPARSAIHFQQLDHAELAYLVE
jgi:hypothetical protein